MGLPKLKTKISVEDYLEGEKISPVKHEYAVVDRHKINIELHRRQSSGSWITYYFDKEDKEIEFQSINLTMPISEIYRRVRFQQDAEPDNE